MVILHDFLLNGWSLPLLQTVFAIGLSVAFYFFAGVFVKYKQVWKVILFEVIFAVVIGLMLATSFLIKGETDVLKLVLTYFIGMIGFEMLFFALLAGLNFTVGNKIAAMAATVLCGLTTIAIYLTQDVFAYMQSPAGDFDTVAVAVVIFFAASAFFGYYRFGSADFWRMTLMFSNNKVKFTPVSAEEMQISDTEKVKNRKWLEDNVLNAPKNGKTPAYSFKLDGKHFLNAVFDWEYTKSSADFNKYRNGETYLVTLNSQTAGLKVEVEATFYASTATSEWTVFLTNVGKVSSKVVSDFHCVNTHLDINNPTMYFNKGSATTNKDFALFEKKLSEAYPCVFVCDYGKPTKWWLPYFNLIGENSGVTVGLGWTGRWKGVFQKSHGINNGFSVTCGQATLNGALNVGEKVRSPLVSVSFYDSISPLKGFNTFRRRVLESLPTKYKSVRTLSFGGAVGEKNLIYNSFEGTKKLVTYLKNEGILDTVDYAWYDASWYDLHGEKTWFDGTGDWRPNSELYPQGFSAVGKYLNENGIKLLAWYEPERVPVSAEFYKLAESKNWLLKRDNVKENNFIIDMGNAEAVKHLAKTIGDSIEENGVSFYRQDCNRNDISKVWASTDRTRDNGRQGFVENKYVCGEYDYLDAFTARFPDLLIDNCASGGQRLDLEMARRSVPLWRTDYNCFNNADLPEAMQYQTYGLSLWLPLNCVGNDWTANEYDYRCSFTPITEVYPSFVVDDTEGYKKFMSDYMQIRGYFTDNYYPLTPCTMDDTLTVAMQFGTEKEGVILVYVRAKAKDDTICLKLFGLNSHDNYLINDNDGDFSVEVDGEELMKEGFSFDTSKKRKASIIKYSVIKRN